MTALELAVAIPCALVGILAIACALLWDALDQRVVERDQARRERDDARAERDVAVHEIGQLLTNQAASQDDTQRLPRWPEFLNPQAAHDRVVTELMEQQFRDAAGGESR